MAHLRNDRKLRQTCRRFVLLLAVLPVYASAARGEEPAKPLAVAPSEFGIDLPAGLVLPGSGRRVTTLDEAGRGCTALVHVRVGAAAIVMLPDGRLVPRTAAQCEATDRPFTPLGMEELGERLTREEFPEFKVKNTRRYLYVYNTSDAFQLATSRILETMFPGIKGYAETQGIEVHDPLVPMVVIMFRTEEEFQKYRRMPEGVLAYYHTLDNRVVMYEQSKLADLKPELAVQQAISTIAHEGVHQILANIGVQKRLSVWPMWLSEGLAEYFAPTSTGQRLRWKGPGQVNDLRMFELENYIKGRDAAAAEGQMIEHTVLAGRLTSTGYAASWALTHHLAKNERVKFHAYLRDVSRLGPLQTGGEIVAPGIVRENLVLFQQHFGDDLATLERRLGDHLRRQPYVHPFAEFPHVVAMVTAVIDNRPMRAANVFHSPALAERWRSQTVERIPEADRAGARSSMQVFENRPLAEAFLRRWLAGQ